MAQYIGSIQPNLNPGTPKVKTIATQVIIDPLKTIWKCPLCGKSMQYLFRECHVKLHGVFSCPLCRDSYPLCDLGPHMIHCMHIHTPDEFQCFICSQVVDSVRHIKTRHISSLVCLIPGCRRTFSSSTFVGHIKNCLKNFARLNPALPTATVKNIKPLKQQAVDSKTTQFKCIFCDSCPSTEFLLRKHIEKIHIKHTCPLCKARDILESNFDEHISKCLKKSNNADNCPICGKHLANKIDHIHKTHSTLNITCPSCKEKFKCGLIAVHAVTCQRPIASKQETCLNKEPVSIISLTPEISRISSTNIHQKTQTFVLNNSSRPAPNSKGDHKSYVAANKVKDIAKVSTPNSKSSDSNPIKDPPRQKHVSFQVSSSQPSDPSSDNELSSLFYESD